MYSQLSECKKAIKVTANISDISERMGKINRLLEGYGIEVITGSCYYHHYWGNIVAEYVNMGNTYNYTVVYDVVKGKFIATSWGDFVEKNQSKYSII